LHTFILPKPAGFSIKKRLDKLLFSSIIIAMGRNKRELKKIHRKKIKKAKRIVGLYSRKELAFEKLTTRGKHFLEKRKKQEKKAA